jgi:hypothetical protein
MDCVKKDSAYHTELALLNHIPTKCAYWGFPITIETCVMYAGAGLSMNSGNKGISNMNY